MSRGHETKDRRERRHREDRHREPRDHYTTRKRGGGGTAYPEDYPPEYTSDPPAYQSSPPEPEYEPRRSRRGDENTTSRGHRERSTGLNADYYNPSPEPQDYSSRHGRRGGGGSRRTRDPEHRSRRSEDRHDSHRYSKSTPETEDEEDHAYFSPKPRRRAKTTGGGRGRSSSKRYDTDYTDDEPAYSEPETRPAKPSRSKSFLNAIGLGKADKPAERTRGRSPYARSPSRGRRAYSYSPSPTRRHRRASGTEAGLAGGVAGGLASGLKRSNTNWQRAAGSAVKAGATAAFELRHDPSPWVGPKGLKVATAALGAVVMDNFMDDKQHSSKRSRGSGGISSKAAKSLGEAALRHVIKGAGGSGDRGRSSRRRQ